MGFDYIKYKVEHAKYIAIKKMLSDYPFMVEEYNAILHESATADGMPRGSLISDTTGTKAMRLAELSSCLDAVYKALQELPEVYRMEIFEHLVYKRPYTIAASEPTLRRWQYRLIYEIERRLDARHLQPYYLGKNRLN